MSHDDKNGENAEEIAVNEAAWAMLRMRVADHAMRCQEIAAAAVKAYKASLGRQRGERALYGSARPPTVATGETPRTDAAARTDGTVYVAFARQLERELAEEVAGRAAENELNSRAIVEMEASMLSAQASHISAEGRYEDEHDLRVAAEARLSSTAAPSEDHRILEAAYETLKARMVGAETYICELERNASARSAMGDTLIWQRLVWIAEVAERDQSLSEGDRHALNQARAILASTDDTAKRDDGPHSP